MKSTLSIAHKNADTMQIAAATASFSENAVNILRTPEKLSDLTALNSRNEN